MQIRCSIDFLSWTRTFMVWCWHSRKWLLNLSLRVTGTRWRLFNVPAYSYLLFYCISQWKQECRSICFRFSLLWIFWCWPKFLKPIARTLWHLMCSICYNASRLGCYKRGYIDRILGKQMDDWVSEDIGNSVVGYGIRLIFHFSCSLVTAMQAANL